MIYGKKVTIQRNCQDVKKHRQNIALSKEILGIWELYKKSCYNNVR